MVSISNEYSMTGSIVFPYSPFSLIVEEVDGFRVGDDVVGRNDIVGLTVGLIVVGLNDTVCTNVTVGSNEGIFVEDRGSNVGWKVPYDGTADGATVGNVKEMRDGLDEGLDVGLNVGNTLGNNVGFLVGNDVGFDTSVTWFDDITRQKTAWTFTNG